MSKYVDVQAQIYGDGPFNTVDCQGYAAGNYQVDSTSGRDDLFEYLGTLFDLSQEDTSQSCPQTITLTLRYS